MGSAPSALTQERYDEAAASAAVGEAFDATRFRALADDHGFVSNADLACAVSRRRLADPDARAERARTQVAAARAPTDTDRAVVTLGVSVRVGDVATVGVPVTVSAAGAGGVSHAGTRCDVCGAHPIVGPCFVSDAGGARSALCAADYARLDAATAASFVEVAVHVGLACDGCGAHPITGPRFSRAQYTRDQHDLCADCAGTLDAAARAAFEEVPVPIPLDVIVRRTVEREAAQINAALAAPSAS